MLATSLLNPRAVVATSSEETLRQLREKIVEFSSLTSLVICGDFNARWSPPPPPEIIDQVKNNQGEAFVDFLRSVDMCIVNGGKGIDAFTYGSNTGSLVVDYSGVGGGESGHCLQLPSYINVRKY